MQKDPVPADPSVLENAKTVYDVTSFMTNTENMQDFSYNCGYRFVTKSNANV